MLRKVKRFAQLRFSFPLPYKLIQLVACHGGSLQKTSSKGNKKTEGVKGHPYPASASHWHEVSSRSQAL